VQNVIKNNRYEFIDLLKAIAIFSVVIYHFSNMTPNLLKTQDVFTYFNYFLKAILSASVSIFFFVNGALILNKDLNLKKHAFKLITIIILTVVWGIITVLLLMPIKNEYMSLFEFGKTLWTWKLGWINHLWFLQTLVIIYMFFPLIKTAYDNNINNLYFFLVIVFVLTFGNIFLSNCVNIGELVIHKNNLKGNFNFFNTFNAFKGIYGYSIVYFILGGLFFKYKEKFYEKKWVKLAIATIVIAMLVMTAYGLLISKGNGEIYDTVWNGLDTIPTLFMVIAIFILSLRYKGKAKISKLIRVVGKNSLGIYFVHIMYGSLFLEYFKKTPFSQSLITNLLFGITITLISLLTVLAIKKIPVVKNWLLFKRDLVLYPKHHGKLLKNITAVFLTWNFIRRSNRYSRFYNSINNM